MDEVKVSVKVKDLITKLKEHRKEHLKDYNIACDVYFEDLVDMFDKFQRDAECSTFREDNYRNTLTPPKNLLKTYDKHIGFLKMSESETIDITIEDYDEIMNDNWSWASSAKLINAAYTSKVGL